MFYNCHIITKQFSYWLLILPLITLQWYLVQLNTVSSEKNGQQFSDKIFKCILLNANSCMLIEISLKFVSEGPIDVKSALVETMVCNWTGAKPLPEPMMTTMFYGITGPQRVKTQMMWFVVTACQLFWKNATWSKIIDGQRKLGKTVQFCNQNYPCWWLGMDRCFNISSNEDNQVQVHYSDYVLTH